MTSAMGGSSIITPRSRRPRAPSRLVGTAWQVSTHPSATSSSVRALLTCMEAVPSSNLAMQVAQLPDSQENGGDMPIWRAVCRIVVPGRCSVDSVRPSSSMVTCEGAGSSPSVTDLRDPLVRGEPLDVDPVGSTPSAQQGGLHDVHERGRAADVEVGVHGGVDELADIVRTDEPVVDVEVVVQA